MLSLLPWSPESEFSPAQITHKSDIGIEIATFLPFVESYIGKTLSKVDGKVSQVHFAKPSSRSESTLLSHSHLIEIPIAIYREISFCRWT